MNTNAGRESWLIVTLRLKNGERLPFVVDTGAPVTAFDKSLEPKLGKFLGPGSVQKFGARVAVSNYAAPELYLGNTRLISALPNVWTFDLDLPPCEGVRVMGLLGMDVLRHYCIQLDFGKGKVYFLDDEHVKNRQTWGTPLPLSNLGDGRFAVAGNLVGTKSPVSLIDTGYNGDGRLTADLFHQWTNRMTLPRNDEVHFPNGVLDGENYRFLDLECGGNEEKFNVIGLHVLSENLVTFDFPKRMMYLKRTSRWPLFSRDHEPAATAAENSGVDWLLTLKKAGKLPGWSKDEHGQATAVILSHQPNLESLTVSAQKDGDSVMYYYQVTRQSTNSPWSIQKAWRTDQSDHTIEEYLVR